jgi:hypothetical protein
MKTTLNKIRQHKPCKKGWETLLASLGKTKADDEPLDLLNILESNGLDDALWCLRTVEGQDQKIRKLACDFALSVAHLWDMPKIVRQYLETQNEDIRKEAYAAAAAVAAYAYAAYAYTYAAAAYAGGAAAGGASGGAAGGAAAALAAATGAGDAAYAAGDAHTSNGTKNTLELFKTFLKEV